MKKIALLLLAAALLTASRFMAGEETAVPGEYVRIVIPNAHVCAAIQALNFVDGRWERPNHETAWHLAPYPQAIYMHRDFLGAELDRLGAGDLVYLYQDWLAEDEPLQLRVAGLEIISAEREESVVLAQVGEGLFAIVTCHPPGSEKERLVIWTVVDTGPRVAYFGRGDTSELLARRYGVSSAVLLRQNNLKPGDLKPGMWLKIPER